MEYEIPTDASYLVGLPPLTGIFAEERNARAKFERGMVYSGEMGGVKMDNWIYYMYN